MRKIYLLSLFTVLVFFGKAQTIYHLTDTLYTVSQLDTAASHSFSILDSLYVTGSSISNDSVNFGAKANNTVLNSQQFTATSFTPNDTLFQNQRYPVTFTFQEIRYLPL